MNKHYNNRYDKFIKALQHKYRNGYPDDRYGEVHHIIPKSKGGSNAAHNLIKISAREHYILHWMLAKAYGGGMWYAFNMMTQNTSKGDGRSAIKTSSIFYERCKKELSNIYRKVVKGVPKSSAHKEKISNRRKTSKWVTNGAIEMQVVNTLLDDFFVDNPSFVLGRCDGYKETMRNKDYSNRERGILYALDIKSGAVVKLSSEEYNANRELYRFGPTNMVNTIERGMVDLDTFYREGLTNHRKGTATVMDKNDPNYPNGKTFSISVTHEYYLSGRYVNIGIVQGMKQLGSNNPNFKGWYHTPYGIFESQRAFKEGSGRDAGLLTRCIENHKLLKAIHVSKPNELATKEDIGKTFKELGWWFEEYTGG